jgi:hypothetical protein
MHSFEVQTFIAREGSVTPSNESSTSIGFMCSSDVIETLGETLSIVPVEKLQTNDILQSQWPY